MTCFILLVTLIGYVELLQACYLLLEPLEDHDWRELIQSLDTKLHNSIIGFAGRRVSCLQISRLEILGHLESFIHLILDLHFVLALGCLKLLNSPIDLLPGLAQLQGMFALAVEVA